MQKSVERATRGRSKSSPKKKTTKLSKKSIINANLDEFRKLRDSFASLKQRHAQNTDLESAASSQVNLRYYPENGSTALDSDVM